MHYLILTIIPGDEHLPYLFRVLHELSARWYSFSVQLGVAGQEQIQRHGRAVDECLALALLEWLQSGDASWKSLVEAVFIPSGGAHQVMARRITDSYRGEHKNLMYHHISDLWDSCLLLAYM